MTGAFRGRGAALAAVLTVLALAGCGSSPGHVAGKGGPSSGGAPAQTTPPRTAPAPPPPPPPPLPKSFVGVSARNVFDAASDAGFARMAAAGVGTVREPVSWALLEPSPGAYDWSPFDAGVTAAVRHGIDVLPMILTAPPWALPAGVHYTAGGPLYPPRDPELLGSFLAAMVERYGPHGSFWTANPSLPKRPIRAWEVWNEPNLPRYWADHPDAAGYVRLVRAASRAIHHADPGAKVVGAGIPNSHLGVPFARFVREVYAAGGRGSFDVFALHPYAADARAAMTAIVQARSLLRRLGDGRTPIWVTEVGWAAGGPGSGFTAGRRGQARDVSRLIDQVARQRIQLGISGLLYYQWQDLATPAGGHDTWGYHTGLLTAAGAPKPALAAFTRAVRAARR